MANVHKLRALLQTLFGMLILLVKLSLMKRNRQQEDAKVAHSIAIRKFFNSNQKVLFLMVYFHTTAITQMSCIAAECCSISEYYVKPRSLDWWNHYVCAAHGDDKRFKEIFRLPMKLFEDLSNLLREQLQQGDIPASLLQVNGRILPVEKQVAVALFRLASGARMIEISEHFGIGKATVSKILRKFVRALLVYRAHFIFWPRDRLHMESVKRGFLLQQGLPNCCGAIDVTHVNMEKPRCESGVDWFDRNKNYSMSVQCVVDMDLRFMDVFAGWPGSANDKRIIRNSSFAHRIEQGLYLNGPRFRHGLLSIREYVVGDGGYALKDWMMVPYTLPHTQRQRLFNFKLSSTRIVVERAFGHLKNQWRYLNGKIACPNPREVSKIIVVCCMLHNMLVDMDLHMERDLEIPVLYDQARVVVRQNAIVLRNLLARYVCQR